MSVEKMKAEANNVMSKPVCKMNMCGREYTVTGLCVLAAAAVFVMHVVMIKSICKKIAKLKCQAKAAKEKEE